MRASKARVSMLNTLSKVLLDSIRWDVPGERANKIDFSKRCYGNERATFCCFKLQLVNGSILGRVSACSIYRSTFVS